MLGIFFIVPFGLMAAVSFFHRQPGGFYIPGFELNNYKNLYSALFGRTLVFSLFVAGLSAAVCVSIGFPFTYFITRMKRRAQVVWLVLLMSILSLSEVIVGFAWSLLLSRTAGLSNIFVWLGLMERPVAWYPGFVALIFGICYLAFPYTVLVLYPPLSRLDPALPEAAQTLGASPVRTFFSVVVGSLRNAIVAAFVMVFVFTLDPFGADHRRGHLSDQYAACSGHGDIFHVCKPCAGGIDHDDWQRQTGKILIERIRAQLGVICYSLLELDDISILSF
jgi:putative spermidine/putrescine transport system permease protein